MPARGVVEPVVVGAPVPARVARTEFGGFRVFQVLTASADLSWVFGADVDPFRTYRLAADQALRGRRGDRHTRR